MSLNGMSLNAEAKKALDRLASDLETTLDADVTALVGPLGDTSYILMREAVEAVTPRRGKLAILLHTGGGDVVASERIVNLVRHFYKEVVFIVPDRALSAGTVLAMSGDAIYMDYASCLGPIDPQVEKNGVWVPALSYLIQYERLVEKSGQGTLTDAEFVIMKSSFDQAELHQFEMARDLSIRLLKKWLSTYKFKTWVKTASRGVSVTPEMKDARAEEIATLLMKHDRWGFHSRGIPMQVLRDELNLLVDDFGANAKLNPLVRDYFDLLVDYASKNRYPNLIHNRHFI